MLVPMRKRVFTRLLIAVIVVVSGRGVVRAQSAPTKPGEKVPSVIPAPKAEPVVPPSPAKSIAQQLNDAFVSVCSSASLRRWSSST